MIGIPRSVGRSLTSVRHAAIAVAGTFISCLAHANCTEAPVSGKTYYIVNEGSGLQLDVYGYSSDDGAKITQSVNNGAPNQQWTVTQLSNGFWTLRPVHSNKSLDVTGWSKTDGTAIQQWSYSGYQSQQWSFDRTSSGSVKISSTLSWALLTVDDDKRGSPLLQRWDKSSANQRWYFNPTDGRCNGYYNASFMGRGKVMVGMKHDGDTWKNAPLDARYQYLSSGPAKDSACYSSCTGSSSCSGWWGCWQDPNLPPGQRPADAIKEGAAATWQGVANPMLHYWTYYGFLAVAKEAGADEGPTQVAQLNNGWSIRRYLDDWRFLLQKVGDNPVMLHIEPDLWGFVRQVNSNPHLVPAAVRDGNPTDCSWFENSAAGLARCMISMARKYAPNAKVGLHVSPWNYKAEGDAELVANYMRELGAMDGDFIATDPADRDAGYYEVVKGKPYYWWNDQDAYAFLAWSKALSQKLGKPTVMWQLPLGNMQMNNTNTHWKDNRVDWLFAHMEDVANAHIVALLFGSGEGVQTTPETDGGNFYYKATEYRKKSGVWMR